MASVGTLRPDGLRRRLTLALGPIKHRPSQSQSVMKIFAALFALISLVTTAAFPTFAQSTSGSTEQAVIVHFKYGSRDLKRLYELEDRLEAALTKSKAGSYDGNEVATDGSDGFLYFYAPSAD